MNLLVVTLETGLLRMIGLRIQTDAVGILQDAFPRKIPPSLTGSVGHSLLQKPHFGSLTQHLLPLQEIPLFRFLVKI